MKKKGIIFRTLSIVKHRNHIYLLLILVVCWLVVGSAQAQQSLAEAYIVKSDANAGELNSLYLDLLMNEHLSNNERFFVIARLGRGERERSLNLKRLHAARSNLVELKGINKEQVILAEGKQIAGPGRLEFYLGSRLRLVSLAARGKNVSLVCCESYPPQKNKKPEKEKI